MECLKSTCIVLVDIHSEQVSYFFLSEKDYPPVARAGNDVVIVLPVDHVTLYGNGSTDDKVKHCNDLLLLHFFMYQYTNCLISAILVVFFVGDCQL